MAISIKNISRFSGATISKKKLFVALLLTVGFISIYNISDPYLTFVSSKKEVESIELKASAFKNGVGDATQAKGGDISFYRDSINAYARVNGLNGLMVTKDEKSSYVDSMKIRVTYPEMDKEMFIATVRAFSKLGYIESANKAEMVIYVIPFTRADAINQLGAKQ